MSDRILSRHGNVIAADFRRDRLADLSITLASETLFCDGHVMLTRTTASMGGQPVAVMHFTGNLETGHIVNL